MTTRRLCTATVLLVCAMLGSVSSHGRMFMPPGRSSVWRHEPYKSTLKLTKNYNDNQQFCGGKEYQKEMGGACGVCGDPFDAPRENEVGGRFVRADWRPIVANYSAGQVATFTVEITANHRGFVTFKLCAVNDFGVEATQDCLDQHPVQLAPSYRNMYHFGTNIRDDERYAIPAGTGRFDVGVMIPSDVTCGLCTLQWRYRAGNDWMENYDPRIPQEEFYACSDIGIFGDGYTPVTANPTLVPQTSPAPTAQPCICEDSTTAQKPQLSTLITQAQTTAKPATTTTKPATTTTKKATTTTKALKPENGGCTALAPWNNEKTKTWCINNCKLNHCPRSICHSNCRSLCNRVC